MDMAKMACPCGYVFKFDVDPEKYDRCLLPMKFILDTAESLDNGQVDGDEFFSRCSSSGLDVHICPQCGRVHIETEEGSGIFAAYVRETKPES
jgi:hypothetical protein